MPTRKPGRMKDLGDETVNETDAELADEEAALLLRTDVDWERLRPKISDQPTYDRLIAAVQEATRRNESMAQLRNRLKDLGTAGMSLAKKVAGLFK